jgi:hypothetical protein
LTNEGAWSAHSHDRIFGAATHNSGMVDLPIHYVERAAGDEGDQVLRNDVIMLRSCWVVFRKLKMA